MINVRLKNDTFEADMMNDFIKYEEAAVSYYSNQD